ncbi:MAG TPA: hypothetical protein VH396_09340 [Chitinophagaceae bacterium]
MEHRKRSMMQQKVELSTQLRIVMASRKISKFRHNGSASYNVTKALASEAIESLKNCDHCETTAKTQNAASSFAVI